MGMDKKIINKTTGYKNIIVYVFVAIIFTFLLIAMFNENTNSLNVKSERLKTFKISKQEFQEYIPVRGNILPLKTIYLDAIEGGRVEEIFVKSGTILKKDDPILRLENSNLLMDIMYREAEFYEQSNNLRNTRLLYEQNLLKLKNDLIEYEYQFNNNKRAYERNKLLNNQKFISDEEFEASKNNYNYIKKKLELTKESQRVDSIFRIQQIKQLEISLNRMESNLKFVKRKLDNLIIRSPIDGQLSAMNIELGEFVAKSSRIGQVDKIDKFKIQAPVDEHFLPRINIGNIGSFTFDNKSFKIKISKIYPEIRGDGSFLVDFDLGDNDIDGLRRGQSQDIRLELGNPSKTKLIARGGFYNQTGGNWVYVMNKEKTKAKKRKIKIGRQNPEYFELKEGLEIGEEVIISSYANYNEAEILNIKKFE